MAGDPTMGVKPPSELKGQRGKDLKNLDNGKEV